jgi:hypothetical protein
MADKTQLEQMLEHLVNDEQAKAEELFHEYVVTKSREIYENLIQEEMDEEEVDEASEKDEDESVDEASKDDDAEEDKVDESSDEEVDESSDDEEVDEEFEEVAVEGDDEEGEMDAMGGDATDDLEADIEDGEEGEKEPEELFTDLESIVDELQAKFDEIKGGDDSEGEEAPEEAPEEEAIVVADEQPDELATFREYVEKVAGGHGAEKKGAADTADNKKSVVDNMKNDMGGTTANIAKGGEASEKNDGGLADIKAKDIDSGNVNVPGAKKAADLSAVKGGHGAEKAGAKEQADNKASIFRGRR